MPQDVNCILMFSPNESLYLKKKNMEEEFNKKHGRLIFKNLR